MIQNNAKAAFTSASIHKFNAVIQGSLTSSTIESINTRNSSNSAALYNSPANPSYSSAVEIRTVPSLLNPVAKGQKIPLSSFSAEGLDVRLGWNVKNSVCDIDVSAFLLSRQGKVPGDDWFVFYGQPQSPDHSVLFSQIKDPWDREKIAVHFSRLNPAVEKIVFVLTIHEALQNHLNFSMVKDACIRIMDSSSGQELVSYRMDQYYSNVISMMIGELYKYKGSWKFHAIGDGVAKDLKGLCELYGVRVL